MKKSVLILFAFIFALLFASCNSSSGEGSSEIDKQNQSVVVHVPSDTKIFNDFAAQLPDFNFSNAIIENYDESVKYVFSVKSSESEFNSYIKSLKDVGFVNGTEGAPISGEGYYKATNSDRYMVEVVLVNSSDLTVIVTRP